MVATIDSFIGFLRSGVSQIMVEFHSTNRTREAAQELAATEKKRVSPSPAVREKAGVIQHDEKKWFDSRELAKQKSAWWRIYLAKGALLLLAGSKAARDALQAKAMAAG